MKDTRAGIRDPNLVRFTITECGKANVPLADVKAISGIKDVQVLLEFYSHTTNEGQDKVLEVTRF